MKNKEGKNVFIDGGAEIVNALLKYNLIDEFIISIVPIFLGSGIRLFKEESPEQRIDLISSKKFKSGLVQLRYQKTTLIKISHKCNT